MKPFRVVRRANLHHRQSPVPFLISHHADGTATASPNPGVPLSAGHHLLRSWNPPPLRQSFSPFARCLQTQTQTTPSCLRSQSESVLHVLEGGFGGCPRAASVQEKVVSAQHISTARQTLTSSMHNLISSPHISLPVPRTASTRLIEQSTKPPRGSGPESESVSTWDANDMAKCFFYCAMPLARAFVAARSPHTLHLRFLLFSRYAT